ncbi:uncharacterized protein TM35_000232410, partial [Trypanosoma theileri]
VPIQDVAPLVAYEEVLPVTIRDPDALVASEEEFSVPIQDVAPLVAFEEVLPVPIDDDADTVVTRHRVRFDGDVWGLVLEHRRAELERAFDTDVCDALGIPRGSVFGAKYVLGSLSVQFDLRHASSLRQSDVDKALAACEFKETWKLYVLYVPVGDADGMVVPLRAYEEALSAPVKNPVSLVAFEEQLPVLSNNCVYLVAFEEQVAVCPATVGVSPRVLEKKLSVCFASKDDLPVVSTMEEDETGRPSTAAVSPRVLEKNLSVCFASKNDLPVVSTMEEDETIRPSTAAVSPRVLEKNLSVCFASKNDLPVVGTMEEDETIRPSTAAVSPKVLEKNLSVCFASKNDLPVVGTME